MTIKGNAVTCSWTVPNLIVWTPERPHSPFIAYTRLSGKKSEVGFSEFPQVMDHSEAIWAAKLAKQSLGIRVVHVNKTQRPGNYFIGRKPTWQKRMNPLANSEARKARREMINNA